MKRIILLCSIFFNTNIRAVVVDNCRIVPDWLHTRTIRISGFPDGDRRYTFDKYTVFELLSGDHDISVEDNEYYLTADKRGRVWLRKLTKAHYLGADSRFHKKNCFKRFATQIVQLAQRSSGNRVAPQN